MANYPSIRIEGGLLGPDLLDQLRAEELPGQRPADFAAPRLGSVATKTRAKGAQVCKERPVDGGEPRPKRNLTNEIARAFADARSLWSIFQHRYERLPTGDPGTSMTRASWVEPFLGLLDYDLIYNRRAYDLGGLTLAISHRAGAPQDAPPIHIVGIGQELGRAPASGRSRLAPHALLQEYLNRTEALWGLVTNGRTLRLLRDCTYVRRQAYIEFDLTGILDEQRFADFEALYRLLHRSRLPESAADAGDCLLERYYAHGVEQGGRVRERLRDGVEQCIERLANGFLRHPANDDLRRRLRTNAPRERRLTERDLYRHLLVLVYRFLFLLVAEDRELIGKSQLYRRHYGIGRLRRLLDRPAAEVDHDDLWQSLRVLWWVFTDAGPAHEIGSRPLATLLDLPVLNGDLFAPNPIDEATIDNRHLISAFDCLARYQEGNGPPRRVNYAALDVEELGSVYESLLDFRPVVETYADGHPVFTLAAGSERKSTGSFYTPPALVAQLIASTLDPVLEATLAPYATPAERERAVLSLRVCDPACGSGHFLLAAVRHLGKALACIRTGDQEPPPEQVRESIRDVVTHSVYGVDRNPLAVDLCRVALWIESHAANKPLTFLDHRIRCGDSLIGVLTLSVLADGVPDDAFRPVTGDPKAARIQKAQNRREREDGQYRLPWNTGTVLAGLANASREVEAIADDSPEAIRRKRTLFQQRYTDPVRRHQHQACNLWTAAFFESVRPGGRAVTTATLADHLAGGSVDARDLAAAEALAADHRFFHWPLEFPEVFDERTAAGFDVVLGNPPWVSYTGRQRVVVSPGVLRLLLHRFPSVARWPATHTAFSILAVKLLAKHRRAGLVLPKQIAELAAYGPARAEITATARLSELVDAGEDAFSGVTQTVGLFAFVVDANNAHSSEAIWSSSSANRLHGHKRSTVPQSSPLTGLVQLLHDCPRFQPKAFADSGVHTGNISKKLIVNSRPADSQTYAPVREGRDIGAYLCKAPRKWIWTTPSLLDGEYCRIRQEQYYQHVPIVLRQTANRPVAARHCGPTYFRNSLLACTGIDGVPTTIVIAFLNSALYAWLHRAASGDANQKTFPQVKLRHLRALPGIPIDALNRNSEGVSLRSIINAAVLEIEGRVRSEEHGDLREALEQIERAVLSSFDLDPDLAALLLEAVE